MFRVCKRFVVESGHMLSRHPERCRFPHGHTRTIEIVVESESLDATGMVVDFKALKLACCEAVEAFDHALAINTDDPNFPMMQASFPDGLVPFEGHEPTTEAMAHRLFATLQSVVEQGYRSPDGLYEIEPGRIRLRRVRVSETPTTWAEFEA